MQETQPDRTPRWRECSKQAARAAQAYIAATWRGLSPESRKKSKQAIAAFIISVILLFCLTVATLAVGLYILE